MRLPDFALERFFARFEFEVRHNLCASDVEPLSLTELLALADDRGRALWSDLRLGYTESNGHPALRAAVAALYRTIAPDEVLAFAGAEEALFVLLQVMVAPGDHVIVTWPAYQSLHEIARGAGAEVTLHRLDESAGWAVDLEALRRAVRPSTRAMVVNFPHNPTGAQLDAAALDAIVDIARDAGCWLVSDEVYRGLEHDAPVLPAAADLYDKAVSVGVLSKTYGLAGLRVGWMATRDSDLRRRAAAFKDYTTICNAAPSEALAIIALGAHEALRQRALSIVRGNLGPVAELMEAWQSAVAWAPPRAGSVAFPRFTRPFDVDRFVEDLAREEGVLLLPGSVFGVADHFRIGLGRRDAPEALVRLDRHLTRHLG